MIVAICDFMWFVNFLNDSRQTKKDATGLDAKERCAATKTQRRTQKRGMTYRGMETVEP